MRRGIQARPHPCSVHSGAGSFIGLERNMKNWKFPDLLKAPLVLIGILLLVWALFEIAAAL